MTVRKRKDGRWQVDFVYTANDRTRRRCKQAAKGARNRSEALAWEAKRRQELERAPASPIVIPPLFRDFAPEFLQAMRTANKPSEVQSKEAMLRLYLVPAFGALRVNEIGARVVETAKVSWALYGASSKTINNRLICLGKALSTAKEWGLLATLPTIRKCRVEEKELDFLTPAESARLVAAADPGMWRIWRRSPRSLTAASHLVHHARRVPSLQDNARIP